VIDELVVQTKLSDHVVAMVDGLVNCYLLRSWLVKFNDIAIWISNKNKGRTIRGRNRPLGNIAAC
jgi:hypothetical protein